MATSMSYTGATSGSPNKTVTLSAILSDALGRGLDGMVVVFTLGTQTVSATTVNGGVATASLQLTQKNGNYPLNARWTPSATDADKWTGSVSSTTFQLQ
jgi:hypothetical protein